MLSFLLKMLGDPNEKKVKSIMGIIDHINALEPQFEAMTDDELRAKTDEFKEILSKRPTSRDFKTDRKLEKEALDKILPEAFATVREAGKRVLNMRHFDVQLVGGYFLHNGHIAEMRTGEGKTLVATLPAYLNALTGKGVHVITVNDYLAKRDSEWMGKIYKFLGLSVGVILSGGRTAEDFAAKKAAYDCDITYGTNNEFGFDYLRDNMAGSLEMLVQRPYNYAIIDEVDSILIDEARTPLIISGRLDKSAETYQMMAKVAPQLEKVKDYEVDEKNKNIILTEDGIDKAQEIIGVKDLFDINTQYAHHLLQALKAKELFVKDTDYVIKNGEIMIVDEFTGRLMEGRRWSDGLHQAIEAKENVKVERESKTLATITFQNYFRLYKKLSGMTGTAMTEEGEFREIYTLDVIEIPTNKPMIRVDEPDVLFKTESAKFNAIIEQILECNAKGQPVLVGTISIEKSEALSAALKKRGIKHTVLNAKYHEKEAEIVAQAGSFGAVTIATNMAGRGTDIILGGNPEFMAKAEMRRLQFPEELIEEATGFAETDNEDIINARNTYRELENKYKEQLRDEAEKVRNAGGLFIIGTERHESRRIDNQLRGRSGRQGDPGRSKFYLSAEDELLRLFAGDRFYNILDTFGAAGELPLETKMFTNTIEGAQKRVEGNNFAARRNVLRFDDVMSKQREVIYGERNKVLDGADIHGTIISMIEKYIDETVEFFCPSANNPEDWNKAGLISKLRFLCGDETPEYDTSAEYADYFREKALGTYDAKCKEYGEAIMNEIERKVLLRNVDIHWMDHLDAMDELQRGIYLRSYGQQDPVVAFRMESFDYFDEMNAQIREGTATMLLTFRLKSEEDIKREQTAKITGASGASDGSEKKQPVKKGKKVGRNEPCPCGSGKKYKQCCGKDE